MDPLNLYLLTQTEECGYDTYDSCIVAAESEDAARAIHPRGGVKLIGTEWTEDWGVWASTPANVKASLIGTAAPGIPAGVILASYNAG